TSITLVGSDGKSNQLLRNEIDELSSTGQSLMPEGLEKDLNPKELADLIAFLRSNQPAQKRREFPGNEPKTVRPDDDTIFRLFPKSAAIFGKTIVIEEKHANLGYWSSAEDHVVWRVAVPKTQSYDVWIYYACPKDSAGNTMAVEVGKERVTYKVEATDSWDDYRGVRIGLVRFEAGEREITIRAEGAIRGALADVKKVELSPR
ncbi:MAG: dehydrogenase, partial [Planctomycetes bacterium]|nr:dehydrogenase [Planctomycetota bacterium]